jgi:hypothetical protein
MAMPERTPDDNPIDAIEVLPLVHVPPAELLLNVEKPPVHTVVIPDIVAGNGFTLTTFTDEQPVDSRV